MLQRRGGKRMGVLDGKAALVTGASKGIGAGIAKGLAAAGASVVVNYASSKEGADRVVSEIAERGGTAFAAQGDVSKSGDVKQLFEDVAREFGSLDVLVNNAGVYSFGPLESVTEAKLGGISGETRGRFPISRRRIKFVTIGGWPRRVAQA
jgi:3-oxoacyl-[acyl-carrier protein] reductase